MKLSLRHFFFLVMPPVLWAGNAVVGRLMVPHLPPVFMNALRWALVALFMAPWCWRVLRQTDTLRRRWPYLLGVGTLGVGSYNALQYLALQTSTPLNATLLGASMPMWMMAVGAVAFGQRVTRAQVAGAGLCMAGVLLVLSQGRWQVLMRIEFVPGDLLMLLAALLWSVYSWLLARPVAAMQGPPAWSWAPFLWLQVLFGLLGASAGAAIEGASSVRPVAWPATPSDAALVAASLLYVAIGPSILAYWGWGQGVKAAGPTVAAFFSNLIPVFAALWAWLLLGTVPQWYHPLALLFIAAGIGVSSGWAPRWRQRLKGDSPRQ